MIVERDLAPELLAAAAQAPAVTLTGPRGSGKTTLCRHLFPTHPYRTLDAPDQRAFAATDPRGFLAGLPHGAVVDEIQRVPELLSYLQGVIDSDPRPGRWILVASQDLARLESVTQSLAGRTEVFDLLPLSWNEIRRFDRRPATLDEAIFAGGYPRIFDRRLDPSRWLRSHVAASVERDARTIVNVRDLATFQRFVELCAGRTARILNYSSLAADCGVSQPTAKAWIGVLEASYVACRLPAFHGPTAKRLVKAPKLLFLDTGLACWLMGIREPRQLIAHPLRGALFETWAITEIMKRRRNRGESRGLSFYRTRGGAEIDLVVDRPGAAPDLVEIKASATPSWALFSGLERARRHFPGEPRTSVVYGGDEAQRRSAGRLVPWRRVHEAVPP